MKNFAKKFVFAYLIPALPASYGLHMMGADIQTTAGFIGMMLFLLGACVSVRIMDRCDAKAKAEKEAGEELE